MEVLPYSATHVQVVVAGNYAEPLDVHVVTDEGNKRLVRLSLLQQSAIVKVPYLPGALYYLASLDGTKLAESRADNVPSLREWSQLGFVFFAIGSGFFFLRKRRGFN